MEICTDLVRLALLIVVHDKAQLPFSVLLAVLKVVVQPHFVVGWRVISEKLLHTVDVWHLLPSMSWPTLVTCLGLAAVLDL